MNLFKTANQTEDKEIETEGRESDLLTCVDTKKLKGEEECVSLEDWTILSKNEKGMSKWLPLNYKVGFLSLFIIPSFKDLFLTNKHVSY